MPVSNGRRAQAPNTRDKKACENAPLEAISNGASSSVNAEQRYRTGGVQSLSPPETLPPEEPLSEEEPPEPEELEEDEEGDPEPPPELEEEPEPELELELEPEEEPE